MTIVNKNFGKKKLEILIWEKKLEILRYPRFVGKGKKTTNCWIFEPLKVKVSWVHL